MFKVLVWSPQTSWTTSFYSTHLYLFKTHYKHHGAFPADVLWYTYDTYSVSQEVLKEDKPNAIFLGVYPWNKANLFEFISLSQTHCPDVPIFVGGVSIPFYDLSEYAGYKNITGLVQGEGEVPITCIVDQLIKQQALNSIPGLWIRQDMTFVKPQKPAPRITWAKGIGPKNDEFFSIEYSWILENQREIFSDITANFEKKPVDDTQSLYFFYETTRGCPYECVYCDWGGGIKTKVRRKPPDMIAQELEIIFKNLSNFLFHLCDANFGIFPQDIHTAKIIKDLCLKYDHAGKINFYFTFAKNNHDNVREIQKILEPVKASYPWNLDIQSTDSHVLQSVKRTQTPLPILVDTYKIGNTGTFFDTNIMICLPGTTWEKDFKTICDVYDTQSQLNAYLTTVPPESEMASPEFRQQWNTKSFKTSFEHSSLNYVVSRVVPNLEIEYMYECSSFSVDEFVDILITYEFLQLLDGMFITKFARLLANENGFDSASFYRPLVDRLFNEPNWLGVDINDIKKSIFDWIYNQQPFGRLGKDELFIHIICKNLVARYNHKKLRHQLLEMVGHMHPSIAVAFDIGFRSIANPFGEKRYEYNAELAYEKYPVCKLITTDVTNQISVISRRDKKFFHDLVGRFHSPLLLDNIISNRPVVNHSSPQS